VDPLSSKLSECIISPKPEMNSRMGLGGALFRTAATPLWQHFCSSGRLSPVDCRVLSEVHRPRCRKMSARTNFLVRLVIFCRIDAWCVTSPSTHAVINSHNNVFFLHTPHTHLVSKLSSTFTPTPNTVTVQQCCKTNRMLWTVYTLAPGFEDPR